MKKIRKKRGNAAALSLSYLADANFHIKINDFFPAGDHAILQT